MEFCELNLTPLVSSPSPYPLSFCSALTAISVEAGFSANTKKAMLQFWDVL